MKLEDEKRFDLSLHLIDYFRARAINLIELRYQLALIIIPSVIGLWGFLGVIVTSKTFENRPIPVYLLFYIGLLATIFLIFIWRTRAHDMFQEELCLHCGELYCEIEACSSSTYVSDAIDDTLQNKKIDKLDADLYKILINSDEEKMKFYDYFKLKLSFSGFDQIEIMAQIAITILCITGLILPYILLPLVFYDKFWTFSWIWDGLHVSIISFFSAGTILQIGRLKDKRTFFPTDIYDNKWKTEKGFRHK
jgi:hypothetical protein